MTSTDSSVGMEAREAGRNEPKADSILSPRGEGTEAVAWLIRRPSAAAGFGRPKVFTTDGASEGDLKQRRRNGYDVQPLYAHPAGGSALPPISHDGPHKPGDNRVWLARQLLDSRLTDEEAYRTVTWSPAISDIWRAGGEAPSVVTQSEASDLEVRAFNAANAPQTTEVYQQLVRDLWRAACDGSEITEAALATLQADGGHGSLRAPPSVPTDTTGDA